MHSKVKYIKALSVHAIKAYGGAEVGSTKFFNLNTRSKSQLYAPAALPAVKDAVPTEWVAGWNPQAAGTI